MDEEQTIPENSTSLMVAEGRSRALRSIQNRISERPGRIRLSLMSRRADYVARSVAGPSMNPNIQFERNLLSNEQYQRIINSDFDGDEMSFFIPKYINNQNVNQNVNEYLFDIDEKEQENLISDIICSICLNGLTEPYVSNDDKNNSSSNNNYVDNKFCHLSCADTHKFHYHCITTWLKQNLTCPCCRAKPEKNNLITSTSEKIGSVNLPMVYTDDPIIEQLRANGSRGITRLREISGMATQYVNSQQRSGSPRIHRIHINSTNTSNQDIQSTSNIFNGISSSYSEILGLNFRQSRPIDFVSQEVNIPEPIQRLLANTIEANDNVNNDEEDYSHIETFELDY